MLSNLGMSYVLTSELERSGEAFCAQAAALPDADSRVRQNLALVVGLSGRFAEAEKIASADLPPDQAAANVAYLKQMLAQQNTWQKLKRRRSAERSAAPNWHRGSPFFVCIVDRCGEAADHARRCARSAPRFPAEWLRSCITGDLDGGRRR